MAANIIIKSLAIIFIIYNIQNVNAGSIRYLQFKSQPAEIQELINNINQEINAVSNRIEIINIQLKTDISIAKLNTKSDLKLFKSVVKDNKDSVCGVDAKASLKYLEALADNIEACEEKDGTKDLEKQLNKAFKTLLDQSYIIDDYCNSLHGNQADIDACISLAIATIQNQVDAVSNDANISIDRIEGEGQACVSNFANKFRDALALANEELQNCLNPARAVPKVVRASLDSAEEPDSEETKESGASGSIETEESPNSEASVEEEDSQQKPVSEESGEKPMSGESGENVKSEESTQENESESPENENSEQSPENKNSEESVEILPENPDEETSTENSVQEQETTETVPEIPEKTPEGEDEPSEQSPENIPENPEALPVNPEEVPENVEQLPETSVPVDLLLPEISEQSPEHAPENVESPANPENPEEVHPNSELSPENIEQVSGNSE